MSIAENVARIRREMDAAALAAGRNPREIQLCAATKMNDADAARPLPPAWTAAEKTGFRSWCASAPRMPTGALPSTSSVTCRPTRSARWWAP